MTNRFYEKTILDGDEIRKILAEEFETDISDVELSVSFGDPQYPYAEPTIYAVVIKDIKEEVI